MNTRFEVAADVAEYIRRYVDTDPTTHNPNGVLAAAREALDHLIAVEAEFEAGSRKPEAVEELCSLVQRWKENHTQYMEDADRAAAFFKKHQKHLANLKRFCSAVEELDKTTVLLRSRVDRLIVGLTTIKTTARERRERDEARIRDLTAQLNECRAKMREEAKAAGAADRGRAKGR